MAQYLTAFARLVREVDCSARHSDREQKIERWAGEMEHLNSKLEGYDLAIGVAEKVDAEMQREEARAKEAAERELHRTQKVRDETPPAPGQSIAMNSAEWDALAGLRGA